MSDNDLGPQLRRNYFGFRLTFTGNAEGAFGDYRQIPGVGAVGGNAGFGGDLALTWRRATSDSGPQSSFEGLGANLGYNFSYTARDSYVHRPYFTFEIWTHDAQLTPYLGAAYTYEQFLAGGSPRHGGQLILGVQGRPFTGPFRGDWANPVIGGHLYVGGEGGDGQGGFVIGLRAEVGMDFFPIF